MNSVDILRKSLIFLCTFFALAGITNADTFINGQSSNFGLPEDTPQTIDSSDYFNTSLTKPQTIKDIEVYGTNVIKPAVVISKMNMHKGDPFDSDMVQRDLKNIYEMGFFTEKMKAIPIENPDGTITLKILLEENIPVRDVTIDGNTVIATELCLKRLYSCKGRYHI